MSEFLTKESKRWAALESVRDLYMEVSREGNLTTDIGKEILQNIHDIFNGDLNITIENWQSYFVDTRDYVGGGGAYGGFGINWFSSNIDMDKEELKARFDGALDEATLRLMIDSLRYWKKEDNELVLSEDFAVFKNPTSKSMLADRTLLMAENGTISKLSTEVIGEILADYSFEFYKEQLAKRITALIQDTSKNTDLPRFGQKFYDEYIGLSTIEESGENFYKLSDTIYKDGKSKKIPVKFLDDNIEIKLLLELPSTQTYPTSIIQTNDGISEDMVKSLLEFNELEGTDVGDYPFQFLINPFEPYTWLGIQQVVQADDNWITKWFKEDEKRRIKTNKYIKNIINVNYFNFLISIVGDIKDGGSLETTIGTQFEKQLSTESISEIFSFIVYDKIVAAKKSLFDSIADSVSDDDDTPNELTEDEIEDAFKNQIKTFKEGKPPDLKGEISEEDIQNRQRFFKQCALMLNMPTLRDTYQKKLNQQYKNKIPYHGRFTTIRSDAGEQETMLSSLVSSAKEQKLFELESHKISRLIPKIRLFKVFSVGGKEKEIEFIFDRTSNIDRPKVKSSPATKFMDVVFDKGTGVGLKNFTFAFSGTNPAEARNDITASLSLFFQSFTDFTRYRSGSNGDFRFVDLVIQPTPDEKGQYEGIDIQSDRQYEPQFYRIRAEVGYVVPTDIDETGMNGFTTEERDAIRVSNKSFFLNMVDHDINFNQDGSVEIKISYRAYLESLLKHPRLDALASPELIKKRIENARELSTQLRKKECTVEQIKELQVSLAAQERVLIKQSLSSIVKRLKSRKMIYTAVIKKEDKEFFLKKGFFQKCVFESGVNDGAEGVDVELVLSSELPESSDDFNFIDSGNRSVQFFYFGDLLYTILDCVYSNEGTVRPGTGFDRNSVILGSFEFEPFQFSDSSDKVYNIADIPISIDFFSRWFVDNVVSQKSTRKTFPVMNFIRTLTNHLIKPSLIENCVNRKLETRLRFQTTQLTAFEKNGANPLKGVYALPKDGRYPVSLEASSLRSSGITPFKGGPQNDANSKFKDFHTFIVVSALGSTLTYSGNGSYSEDIKNGRFHVHIGQNAGLVKKLSLSKSDQQYIREARFFQNGIDGLLQLSAVYVANIEMFGNTLFYPGMEIFFNPYGIGGKNFDPRKPTSIANKLGIGGYHTITSVNSSISPGKFTTSISAQQYYSGDGSGNPNIVKQNNAAKKASSIDAYIPEDPGSEEAYEKCKQVILDAQNYRYSEESITSSVEEPAEEVTEDTAATESTSTEPIDTPSAEEAYGDPEIKNVSRTTETIDGKSIDVVYTQYKDGTVMIKKTIDGVEEVSFA